MEPTSERVYTAEEIAAARKLGVAEKEGRGVIYFAGGDYWPDELDSRAREFDRQAARARMVAAALRREQARW